MSKVIFFGIPYTGHMNGSLPLLRELAARGEQVICYSSERYSDAVRAANAEPRLYGIEKLEGAAPRRLMQCLELVIEVADLFLERELPRLRDDNPDYLIYDSLAVWGHYISRILGVPAVRSNTLLALNREMMRLSMKDSGLLRLLPAFAEIFLKLPGVTRRIKRIRKKYDLPDLEPLDGLVDQNQLNIVHYSADFHPCANTFGDNYRFVGSSTWERWEDCSSFPWDRLNEEPLVYISPGTVYVERTAFYKTCYRALEGLDVQVVLATGGKSQAGLAAPPANFTVVPFAPQLALLKRAAAFVSHAGANSMAEAAGLGVPTVLVPHIGEQRITAAHFEKQGASVVVRGSLTAKKLRYAVTTVLQDPAYRDNTRRIGESLRSAGGAPRAVDEIFDWKRKEAAAVDG